MTKSPNAARPLEDVGVVAEVEDAVERGVVEEPDQRAQGHGADSGDDPDDKREQAQHQKPDPTLVARRRADNRAGERFGLDVASVIGSPDINAPPGQGIRAPQTRGRQSASTTQRRG